RREIAAQRQLERAVTVNVPFHPRTDAVACALARLVPVRERAENAKVGPAVGHHTPDLGVAAAMGVMDRALERQLLEPEFFPHTSTGLFGGGRHVEMSNIEVEVERPVSRGTQLEDRPESAR